MLQNTSYVRALSSILINAHVVWVFLSGEMRRPLWYQRGGWGLPLIPESSGSCSTHTKFFNVLRKTDTLYTFVQLLSYIFKVSVLFKRRRFSGSELPLLQWMQQPLWGLKYKRPNIQRSVCSGSQFWSHDQANPIVFLFIGFRFPRIVFLYLVHCIKKRKVKCLVENVLPSGLLQDLATWRQISVLPQSSCSFSFCSLNSKMIY